MTPLPDPRRPDADFDAAWYAIPVLIVIAVLGLVALGEWMSPAPPPAFTDGGTEPPSIETPAGA